MKTEIRLTVNGEARQLAVDAHATLLDVIRNDLGLTGTKKGCDQGDCGACSIILDERLVKSCLILAVEADGSELVTIEGLQDDQKLHPLQQAFVSHGAIQCGFCTPGMLLAAKVLLDANPRPTEHEIRDAISGNLCRCTGYNKIVEAILSVSRQEQPPRSSQAVILNRKGQEREATAAERVPKLDSAILATGTARFLEDLYLPGMLHGKILRSPHPHARLLAIDTSRAERLPGVRAVITARDTPRIPFCGYPNIVANKLPLCDDKVRFVGDEVAAVAAIDEETAARALELIRVEYELLDAVFDPEEAMAPGAPACHADSVGNIADSFQRSFGDVEKGFRESDFISEDTFRLPRVVSCSLQPHGSIASYDISGRVTLWTSTQNVGNFQRQLAKTLNLPSNNVRIINAQVGGAFGNKSVILPLEPIAAILSHRTGKPVRIVNSREEEFTTARTRYSMVIRLKTGVKKDGTLLARYGRVITDNGAYNNKAPGITLLTCNRIGNLYRVPNVKTEAFIVYTNNQYSCALRGWGGPQAHFAVESQMDIIAHALGMDPLELRLRNANRAGDTTPWGWKITSCGLSQCLEEAARASPRHAGERGGEGTRKRGKGIASVLHTGAGSVGTHGAGNYEAIALKVNPDGSLQARVGVIDIGQGTRTAIAQVIAGVLGIDAYGISLAGDDSDTLPPTMGTWGSRMTYLCGNAALQAADQIRRQLMDVAREMLDAGESADLALRGGCLVQTGSPEKSVSFREVAQYCLTHHGRLISAEVVYNPTNASPPDTNTGFGNYCPTYSFGAQVAHVEVDLETGHVDVLDIVAAHDVGKAINPLLIEGQIDGGVSMGIGYGLLEEIKMQHGTTLNPDFHRYKIVNATEMPDVEKILVETIDPHGPLGAKGVAELTTIPTAAAIANAIFDAAGVRIKDLPITPEKILRALEEARSASAGSERIEVRKRTP